MSLFQPTPGEIADRLSILELKIAAMSKKGKNPKALQSEASLCIEVLTRMSSGDGEHPKLLALLEELKAVNKRIWDLVDFIHGLYEGDVVNAGKVAIQIAQQNDIRFDIVGKINAEFGCEVEEKVYTQ